MRWARRPLEPALGNASEGITCPSRLGFHNFPPPHDSLFATGIFEIPFHAAAEGGQVQCNRIVTTAIWERSRQNTLV
jgi:hypothetical protein